MQIVAVNLIHLDVSELSQSLYTYQGGGRSLYACLCTRSEKGMMACREAKGVAGIYGRGIQGLLLVPGQSVPRRSAWTGTRLVLGHYVLSWI